MTDEHTFREPDPDEGWLYVREWEDHKLQEELQFLAGLFAAVCGEVAFRADHPEHRDDTGDIHAADTGLYALSDEVNHRVTRGAAFRTYNAFEGRD